MHFEVSVFRASILVSFADTQGQVNLSGVILGSNAGASGYKLFSISEDGYLRGQEFSPSFRETNYEMSTLSFIH